MTTAVPETNAQRTYTFRRLFRGSELDGWSFDFAGWVGLRLSPDDDEALRESISDLGLQDFCDRMPWLEFDRRPSRDRGGPGSYDSPFVIGTYDEETSRAGVRAFVLELVAKRREAGLPGGAVEHLRRPTNGRVETGAWGEQHPVPRIGRDHNLLPDGRRLWALVEPARGASFSALDPSAPCFPLAAFSPGERAGRLAQVRAGDPIFAIARAPEPRSRRASKLRTVLGLCTATGAADGGGLPLSPLTRGTPRGLFALIDEPALRDAEPLRQGRATRLFRLTPAEGRRLAELLGVAASWEAG